MDRLPVLERQATVLVRMIGLSHEDAANICDCDIATIEGRMQRARTRRPPCRYEHNIGQPKLMVGQAES
ncbi:hypothetical protein EN933_29020 [Mesorhizobium sp. M7A.F.Ca.US.001.01.1.1]|nr:hypothetical protein EN933_29020 [Mesorhizobium sp. M7A.F.Ca.US.001.01.1.1]